MFWEFNMYELRVRWYLHNDVVSDGTNSILVLFARLVLSSARLAHLNAREPRTNPLPC